MKITRTALSIVLIMMVFAVGCSRDESGLMKSLYYPGAVEDNSFKVNDRAGNKIQDATVYTDDSYEDVISYYDKMIEQFDPKVLSYDREGYRMRGMMFKSDLTHSITIEVLELKNEDRVEISYSVIEKGLAKSIIESII